MSKKGMGKFLIGAGIGAAITALFTTEKGKEYQAKISAMCEEMIKKVRELDSKEVKENIENKIADIKNELADLDKEKVKEKAKKLAKDIEVKTKELAKYAKEKGTPVMEEMAENLRVEAVKATKAVLNKLEKSKKTKKEA